MKTDTAEVILASMTHLGMTRVPLERVFLFSTLSPLVNRSPFPANSFFRAATNFSLIFSLCAESNKAVSLRHTCYKRHA